MGSEPAPEKKVDWAHDIVLVAQQDREAFKRLFAYFAPRVKAMLMRAGTPAGLAEDLAQDTLLMVWRKAHLFDPAGSSPAAWIFTIARNIRIDQVRREARRTKGDNSVQLEEDNWVAGADDQMAVQQAEATVRSAIKELNAEQAAVVRLSFFENRPHTEIAEKLGIPLGTVKSRLRLAMVKLRNLLDPQL